LTYYAIQSIFPGLLVLVSVVGLLGRSTTNAMLANIETLTPGPAREILHGAVNNLQRSRGTAGVLAVVGVVAALWSASGYISAFMRAANAIYDVPEGRPVWKTLPVRLGLTVVTGTLLAASALAIVFTGRLAASIGRVFGIGGAAVTVWDIVKWPVIVIRIALMIAILYRAAPNARQSGFRWITPGSLLAVLLWLVASGAFALYVANFASYNKTYGTLGGVIAFLVWLWITNLVLLLGAELDAEMERGRAMVAGHPEDEEPYVPLRDDRKVGKEAKSDLR